MRPTRLFFAGIMLCSLLYLTTTLMPDEVHAVPKSIMTGEYPEAAGARCMDVDYKTDQTVNGAENGTFVTSPNRQGATLVSIGLYVDQITEVDESSNSFAMQGFLDLIWCDPRLAFARWLTKNEKADQAKQMDRTARWFMPLLYVALILLLYFFYTR